MVHPGAHPKGSSQTAVYRLYAMDGELLYVGIGRNPMARWAAHAEQPWWSEVHRFTVAWFATRAEAVDEERRALRNEAPAHNIQGTPRHGLVTGAGVRRALGAHRRTESQPTTD
jgi:predicted GIY-YIG superfamily endonuclease